MSEPAEVNLERPFRPVTVRAFNALARGLRRLGLRRSLRVEAILNAACRKTGLDDFGDEDFLEPLALLVDQLENEADLNPFGRLMLRKGLETHAANRLLLVAAWKRHPDWLTQAPQRPLYVVGMPRTGTTLLYNLLCQDPTARPLMIYETMFPARTEQEELHGSERRNRSARFFVKMINRLAPNLKAIHSLEPEGPEECGWLLNNTFCSRMFVLDGHIPKYLQYLSDMPYERQLRVYGYYERILRLLQAGDTQKHWVLKSPGHQDMLSALMETIPTAHVIQTHRDPAKVVPSSCSLVAVARGVFSDHIDCSRLGREIAEQLNRANHRAAEAQQKFPDRLTNVLFDMVVKDPIGTVRQIYERFGYDYSPEMEAGMQKWLADNPQGKHGSHKYELEQFGLTQADIDQIFGDYWSHIRQEVSAATAK